MGRPHSLPPPRFLPSSPLFPFSPSPPRWSFLNTLHPLRGKQSQFGGCSLDLPRRAPICSSLVSVCFPSSDHSFPLPGTETFPSAVDMKAEGETVTESDLKRLPEFNPPSFMPFGNVGTPLKVFLELIRACRLPPRIIKKLQLDFPKTGSSRRYGNVPFEYQNTETVIEEERVYTATGDEITEDEGPVARSEVTDPASAEEDEVGQEKEEEESHSDDVSGFL